MPRFEAQDRKENDLVQRTHRVHKARRREELDLPKHPQRRVARDKGFTYYGPMNITLSLPEELVKRVRKIAVDRDTTLTGLVREYLNELARQEAAAGRRRREREALERSFEQFQFRVGKKSWKREDLHERA